MKKNKRTKQKLVTTGFRQFYFLDRWLLLNVFEPFMNFHQQTIFLQRIYKLESLQKINILCAGNRNFLAPFPFFKEHVLGLEKINENRNGLFSAVDHWRFLWPVAAAAAELAAFVE